MVVAIFFIIVFQANSMGTIERKIQNLEEGNTNLRKLGFDFNVEKIFPIKTVSFLGQKLIYKYRVAVKDGKAINQLIIDSNLGSFKFGNTEGVDTETNKTWSGNVRLFTFKCPDNPKIIIAVYAKGSLQTSVKYVSKDSLQMTLTGYLNAISEAISWPMDIRRVTATAFGSLITKASGNVTVTKSGISKEFKFSGSQLNIYVKMYLDIDFLPLTKDVFLFEGWNS